MRSATVSIPNMSSVSPRIGPRHSVDPACTPSPMATRPPSSGSTAVTGCTTRWIAAPSLASTWLWLTSDWPTTPPCGKCCTTTSLGRPRQPWPATTGPLTMCLTVSPFRAGHGADSRSDRQMPVFVNVETVHPRKLAAVRREVPAGAVGAAWGPALGKVWPFIRSQPGQWTNGHNIFLYHHSAQPGAPILCDFGVEVTRTFETAGIRCLPPLNEFLDDVLGAESRASRIAREGASEKEVLSTPLG